MNVLSTASTVLADAGYDVLYVDGRYGQTVLFEDDSLLGVIAVFDTLQLLLENCENVEAWFLTSYATALRSAPIKAWNAYTVILTSAIATPAQELTLEGIEKNFRGTRKIARHSIEDRHKLVEALLPLLPFQSDYKLHRQEVEERLYRRIPLDEKVRSVLFSNSATGRDLAKAILGNL